MLFTTTITINITIIIAIIIIFLIIIIISNLSIMQTSANLVNSQQLV